GAEHVEPLRTGGQQPADRLVAGRPQAGQLTRRARRQLRHQQRRLRAERGGHEHAPRLSRDSLSPSDDLSAVCCENAFMTSSEWGRIDADGTVWVRTESGERQIGSWQAGPPAAGLAHYERRYDDLATEVELLEQRLASGAGDPASTLAHAATLPESLSTAPLIGDLGALDRRLGKLGEAAQAKAE